MTEGRRQKKDYKSIYGDVVVRRDGGGRRDKGILPERTKPHYYDCVLKTIIVKRLLH
jgi:hypothetical protein